MRIKDIPGAFNFLLFVVALALNLTINWQPPLCDGLADPADYIHQSQLSVFDKEFYAPHKTEEFSPRPFTVPLFYKLCGSETGVIIQAQKCLYTFSTFVLLYALLLFIRSNLIKYLLILAVYLLMSWWNILGWSLLLLSESVSMSLLFCWVATFLIWFKKRGNGLLLAHILVMLFFSFTRDSWPYVIVAFNTLIAAWFFISRDVLLKKWLGVLAFAICIYFTQQQTAKTGMRSELPVLNTIAIRMVPNKEHLDWFVKKGMPCSEKLKVDFAGLAVRDTLGQQKIFAFYHDTTYNALFTWVLAKGQATYMQFLITHPAYTFLLEENPEQIQRVFAHDLFYTDEPRGYVQYLPSVFPLWNATTVFVLMLVLLAIYGRRKEPVLIITVCIGLMTLLNAWICYNADALEVERHLFVTGIMIQLLGFWSAAFIADSLGWKREREKVQ